MKLVALSVVLLLSACHGSGKTTRQTKAGAAGKSAVPAPPTNPYESARAKAQTGARLTRAEQREACFYRAGARVLDTLDADAPTGDKIPIEHFVVVMQENRSFDQYFQALPQFGQPDVDVAPSSYGNADPSGEGEIVTPYLQADVCVPDVPHNWIAVHHQIAEGRMNGFLTAASPDGKRALGYYDASTLGYYYALANTFAIGDHYFAAVPGPTFPNRMFALSASSFGHAKNTAPPPRDEEKTIFHQLEGRGLSWAIYSEGTTFEEDMYPRLHQEKGGHFCPMSQLYTDAAAGLLPFFAWVESTYEGALPTDEHAPANVQVGQAFVSRVIGSVMHGKSWPTTALFLTYDEHGGFYDHVKPPHACAPGDESPQIAGIHSNVRFDQLGVRVPFIVVSPFARAHFVSHVVHSHTSILRLVQARADLPALTARDANDQPPFEFFDFEHPPFVTPPALPDPQVDPLQKKRCVSVAREAHVQKAKKKPSIACPATG